MHQQGITRTFNDCEDTANFRRAKYILCWQADHECCNTAVSNKCSSNYFICLFRNPGVVRR